MRKSNQAIHTRTRAKAFTCVDLFAGAGGLSLAAKQSGVKVIAAVEKNAHACETYRNNLIKTHRGTRLYETDILELNPKKLVEDHFKRGPSCDLLLGGPPCQGFSTHRINNAGVDDPRNALVLRYFEFVAALKPKVFLMENVPGILWPRHKRFLDALRREAKRAGYRMHEPVILDARDYGVPQRRRRVFVLGVRNDVRLRSDWPPPATHGSPHAIAHNPHLKTWVPASTVFKRIPAGDPNNVHMKHSPAMVEVFKATPLKGGSRRESGRVLPCHMEHDGHSDVYGRIDPRAPGPTMTTACVNPSKGRFVHPTAHRGISVRHAARFQTFPDNFKFIGGLTAASAQIGNAVPVLLGQVLITFVVRNIRTAQTGKVERRASRKTQSARPRKIAGVLRSQSANRNVA
jgi:DNA (cytosine-5)-methyltransferase 1